MLCSLYDQELENKRALVSQVRGVHELRGLSTQGM